MNIKKIVKLVKNVPLLLMGMCVWGDDSLVLTAVGDMRFDGYIGEKIKEHGAEYPFSRISHIFEESDITYGNLECSLHSEGKAVDKQYVFGAKSGMAAVLKVAGFDIVDLANNHSGDMGEEAFLKTMEVLAEQNILFSGAGTDITASRKPRVFTRNGITVAFLSFSNTFPESFWAGKEKPGVTPAYVSFIREDVSDASREADHVIVCYHGGDERSDMPKQAQKDIAYAAINAGASLVLGHHPHVLQGIEVYKGKPIVYSLGNFLFLSKAKECYDTMIVRAVFAKESIQSLAVIPARIADAYVRKPSDTEAERILRAVQRLSEGLGTGMLLHSTSAYVLLQ